MEEALLTRLTTATGLPEDSTSWGVRARGAALPVLVLNKISPGREYSHDGHDGLDRPRVQADAWAATPEEAAALARAVLAEMETAATVDGVAFHPAQLAGDTWSDEGEQDGGGSLFRISQDFQFFFEEA